MSSLSDYNELLSVIQAINPENTVPPNMPVDVYLQESEDQYHWCVDDEDALTHAGLDWSLITSLPTRAGACLEAQSLWNKERTEKRQRSNDYPRPGFYLPETSHVRNPPLRQVCVLAQCRPPERIQQRLLESKQCFQGESYCGSKSLNSV